MADIAPPLSSTVASVFEAFLKKLAEEKRLPLAAIEALRHALDEQKLDANSLREALFTPAETADDPD
jgi:hypothetical protein